MKRSHIAALVIIAVAIAIIMGTIADSGTYASFSEASENPEKTYHIIGELCSKEQLYYDPLQDPNMFSFCLTDRKGAQRKVIFNGVKPQDFERSEQIVLTGKISGDDFLASKILMKCPSKYNNGKELVEVKNNLKMR